MYGVNQTSSQVPCVLCGTRTEPNDSYMCLGCLKQQVSITDKIERNGELVQCSECERWLIRSDADGRQVRVRDVARVEGRDPIVPIQDLVPQPFFFAKPSPLGIRPPNPDGPSIKPLFRLGWISVGLWCTDSNGPVVCQKSDWECRD